MATPAAYLRKSKDAATKAAHLAALRRFIAACGDDREPVVFDDWARSGGRKSLHKRGAYQAMVAAIVGVQHDRVYALDVGRTNRDTEETLRLERITREAGGSFWTYDDEGSPTDWSLPTNRDRLIETAHFAEKEWRKASRRSQTTLTMQRQRGDKMGHPQYGFMTARQDDGRVVHVPNPDEPIEPVVEAVKETRGNILAACRLLNARGMKARRAHWSPRMLTRVIQRHAPELLRRSARVGGRKSPKGEELTVPSALARLVKCHCGTVMVARDKSGGLYCYNGISGGEGHQNGERYVARQRFVYDALRAEVEAMGKRKDSRVFTNDTSEARTKLDAAEEKLRRLGRAYADGSFDDEEYAERRDAVKAEIDALRGEVVPAEELMAIRVTISRARVRWDADPVTLGDQLRRLFKEVQLGPDLKPVQVVARG